MLRKIAIVFLIMWGGPAFSQSPPDQSIIKQPPAANSATNSNAQKADAPQQPVAVNVIPAPKTEDERAAEAKDRREKAETDAKLTEYTGQLADFTRGLFYATVFLGVATIGLLILGFFQRRDMKESIAASARQAKAAEDATIIALAATNEARQANNIAKEANILQARPWVIVDVALADKVSLQHNGRAQFPIRVTPKNIGKTPAEDLHILVQSRRYQEPGATLADFVKLNTRDGVDFRKMILLPGEGEPQLWPQVPVYDPPDAGEAFKVTLFEFHIGAFYKTPMMDGYRVTAASYIGSIRVNEGNALASDSVVGLSRNGGIVT